MADRSDDEVWVLGATGRSGRAVAARLGALGADLVLVGRDRTRLDAVAADLGGGAGVVAGDLERVAAEIGRRRPAVVVNTVGPFATTAPPLVRACLPHTDYVDLANDATAVEALLARHDEALAAGRTLVTGAGYGFVATEAVVAALCRDRPVPERVRVDALPSAAVAGGVLGEALAATLVDGLAAGGRRYAGGRLVRSRVGADVAHLTTPDGDTVTSAGLPSGDLVAAQRTTGAPAVVAGSSGVPSGRILRAVLPVAVAVLSVPALRGLAVRRLARLRTTARPGPREHSWGHAVVEWSDGTAEEGWLRIGDASEYTAAVLAETALRLERGEGRPGAHTPVAAVGPDLATAAGATLLHGREDR